MILHRILAQLPDPPSTVPRVEAGPDQVRAVLQVVFIVLGIVSVMMVIIGGLLYVTSNGEPQKTARAKDTIMYAIIGLVIAILAQVVIAFALGRVFS